MSKPQIDFTIEEVLYYPSATEYVMRGRVSAEKSFLFTLSRDMYNKIQKTEGEVPPIVLSLGIQFIREHLASLHV